MSRSVVTITFDTAPLRQLGQGIVRIARDPQTGRRIDLAIQIGSAIVPGRSRRLYRDVLGLAIYREPIRPSEKPRLSQIDRKRDDSDPVD